MKKFTSAIAAVLLASLMLTACGGGADQTKEAYAAFLAASQKQQSSKAVDASMDINATMVVGSETLEMVTNVDLVGDMTDAANPSLYTKMYVDSAGEITEMVLYYYDGNMYAEMMGMKIKQAVPAAEIASEEQLSAVPAPLFDETKIKDGKITDKDGGKAITFTVVKPIDHDYIKNATASFATAFEDGGLDPTKVSITADDMVVTAFVDKDGVLKSFSFDLNMKFKYENETAEMKMSLTANINALDNVTVPKPADESIYKVM